ncbi:MAG: Rieske 2Fe-2S domain-containing protein [Planctomycetes bacterium]|nr:Rieske 2Fe-2S domain-containing protein [Planctomycetota bacterium]
MADFHTVARVGEIPEGEGRAFPVAGRMVAVFHVGGEYTAINDFCPHMGASLASGYVENGGVTCPWHAWRFCVKDGTWLDNPNARVKTDAYPVRILGEEIQVQVPERA